MVWRVSACGIFESPRNYKGFVNLCSFEQGITMVWRTSACGMLESPRNYKGFVNLCSFEPGIRMVWRTSACSETKKCSQRFEIGHFCPGKISSLEPSKNGCESNRGTLRFTISISDILMAPSCSLRSFLEVGVS